MEERRLVGEAVILLEKLLSRWSVVSLEKLLCGGVLSRWKGLPSCQTSCSLIGEAVILSEKLSSCLRSCYLVREAVVLSYLIGEAVV